MLTNGDGSTVFFFFQAEDGIRDLIVTGVQTCALPILFGRAAAGAGRFLKRGSIVALGAIDRPATFRYACTYRPPHLPLLLRYLRTRYGLAIGDLQISGRYERYSGDLAELGKGEILQWVAE